MKSAKLYQQLEKDFITSEMSDDWANYMGTVEDYLSENFKKRSIGLVCDFATEIKTVYTAVFPSKEVMQKILDEGAKDAMLFVHHPSIWDIRKDPVFYQMDRELLEQFKNRRIAIYNLHAPLDNYSNYSTSVTLAKALGIKPEKAFAPYNGGLAGVFGKTNMTVQELKEKYESAVGHEVKLYPYGSDKTAGGNAAVVAGGGLGEIKEVVSSKVNVFVTGITAKNEHSKENHDLAKKHKISLLGGTHYSSEKFACIAMVEYFEKLELPAKFVAGEYLKEDM